MIVDNIRSCTKAQESWHVCEKTASNHTSSCCQNEQIQGSKEENIARIKHKNKIIGHSFTYVVPGVVVGPRQKPQVTPQCCRM